MSKTKNRYVKNHKRSAQKKKSLVPLVLSSIGAIFLILFFALQKANPATNTTGVGTTGPVLFVDRQQVDLGDQKLGTSVEVSFKITNTGDEPLKFAEAPYIEVKEGC